jgi:hypothetical protein
MVSTGAAAVQRRRAVKKSQRQERAAANRYGGRTQPGSGSQWHSKGDAKLERFILSQKFTDAESYRLTKNDWLEAVGYGFEESRIPAMEIDIRGVKVFVIDENMFQVLVDAVKAQGL